MATTANWNSHHHHHHRNHRREPESPSFSSTLLDAIYRSIDDAGEAKETTMRKGQNGNFGYEEVLDMASFRRACMIEKWMEKKKAATEKVVVRRKSMADFDRTSRNVRDNTSSSSSDSSSGGFFSSSESSCYNNHNQRPKPIRTEKPKPKPKAQSEGGFVKTKTKALKLYGDLKKVKQPISPGGRLASFLNSIFTAKNAKNAGKKERVNVEYSSSSTTTCSSASSFSRSCLSKTPASSQAKSVRFCPVSVIVDEDCRPCGQKNVYEEKELMAKPKVTHPSKDLELEEEKRRVQDLLKSYHQSRNINIVCFDSDDEEEDDDDASCCSSDLFELDNLSAIGIERYNEELPVYETTHLDTNRAIANSKKKKVPTANLR